MFASLELFVSIPLGGLLVDPWDFNFSGFYTIYNKEAKSLNFRRGSEVSQVMGSSLS